MFCCFGWIFGPNRIKLKLISWKLVICIHLTANPTYMYICCKRRANSFQLQIVLLHDFNNNLRNARRNNSLTYSLNGSISIVNDQRNLIKFFENLWLFSFNCALKGLSFISDAILFYWLQQGRLKASARFGLTYVIAVICLIELFLYLVFSSNWLILFGFQICYFSV